MPHTDPRIDAYIAKSPDFAQPILHHLRRVIRRACPAARETIKWGMPAFVYKKNLCGIAAFKHHCAFFFQYPPVHKFLKAPREKRAMGQFGRITALRGLEAASAKRS